MNDTSTTHIVPSSPSFALPADQHFMTPAQASSYLGLSTRTLDRHRLTALGPKFSRVGRRVIYTRSDLIAWVRAKVFQSTSEEDVARRA